jgi:GTP-binding protein
MTEDTQEQGELQFTAWMFAQDCTFLRGVTRIADLPDSSLPEVAFAGRSNVGKSSLINALTNRKSLARTSNTPGRTQQINFFKLSNHLLIVDLPGYGFANASKKAVNEWTKLIRLYLKGRAVLKRVFILVDSRHGLKPVDKETMDLLDEAGVTYQIVLTKVDKIKPEDSENIKKKIELELKSHAAAYPILLATSTLKQSGIQDLQLTIASLCESS